MDMKLEVAVLPVANVDRAKDFYTALGWRLDADFTSGRDFRVVQLTPPGSACSVIFGTGVTAAPPGSVEQPAGQSYASFAAFTDPDGNGWLLQEITARLPGR
jgi:catechol 2,3-dioxygenase-like lactoylglutathione lyase family enzyme